MSRRFNALAGVPYLGFTGQGGGQQTMLFKAYKEPPTSMPLEIDWLLYGAGASNPIVKVNFDLNQSSNQVKPPLSLIQSVVIDNTGNPASVFVIFDSFFELPCGPDQIAFFNVVTNSLQFSVVGTGFTGGPVPQTTLYMMNIPISPAAGGETAFVAPQYFASVFNGNPILNQTPFRGLATGDLVLQKTLSLPLSLATFTTAQASTMMSNTLAAPPVSLSFQFPNFTGAGQYIYITSVTMFLNYFFNAFQNVGSPAVTIPTAYQPVFSLKDNLGCINLASPWLALRTSMTAITDFVRIAIMTLPGLQIKCRADATFTIAATGNFLFTGAALFNQIAAADFGTFGVNITYTARDENTL